jgi:hypothetical protein
MVETIKNVPSLVVRRPTDAAAALAAAPIGPVASESTDEIKEDR